MESIPLRRGLLFGLTSPRQWACSLAACRLSNRRWEKSACSLLLGGIVENKCDEGRPFRFVEAPVDLRKHRFYRSTSALLIDTSGPWHIRPQCDEGRLFNNFLESLLRHIHCMCTCSENTAVRRPLPFLLIFPVHSFYLFGATPLNFRWVG